MISGYQDITSWDKTHTNPHTSTHAHTHTSTYTRTGKHKISHSQARQIIFNLRKKMIDKKCAHTNSVI